MKTVISIYERGSSYLGALVGRRAAHKGYTVVRERVLRVKWSKPHAVSLAQ